MKSSMSQEIILPTLTKLQSVIYQLLLSRGEVGAADLVEASGFKRSTLYKTLYELEEKGLASKKDFKKKLHFKPESPVRLMDSLSSEVEKLERGRDKLAYLLPQLQSMYVGSTQQPIVQVFVGVEGLKKIYQDTLEVGETIYAALDVDSIDPVLRDWLDTKYVKKRAKLGITAKVIVSSGTLAKPYKVRDLDERRVTRLLNSSQFPFEHEIDIYGDRVAFIHNKAGEELIGIVIRHPNIASTMKSLFELAWVGSQTLI